MTLKITPRSAVAQLGLKEGRGPMGIDAINYWDYPFAIQRTKLSVVEIRGTKFVIGTGRDMLFISVRVAAAT